MYVKITPVRFKVEALHYSVGFIFDFISVTHYGYERGNDIVGWNDNYILCINLQRSLCT